MQLHLTLSTILLLVIISQGIFAAIVLYSNNINKLPSKILAILLIATSLWLLDALFLMGGLYDQEPNLYFKPLYYSLGFGPLIFYYVKTMTYQKFNFTKKDLIHFLPMITQGLFYLFLTSKDYSYRRLFWLEVHKPFTRDLEFNLTFVSLTIYLFLSFFHLRSYQKWVNNNFSEVSKIRLQWLRVVVFLMILLCIQWIVELSLRHLFNSFEWYGYLVTILGVLTLVLAYGGLKQKNISQILFEKEKIVSLPVEINEVILAKIAEEIKTNKTYLDPNLTLKQFASKLELPTRTVSEHINHGMGLSFVDFVNGYRVNEVKRKLATNKKETHTLFAIALDSGFNSKSTFNRIFKKFSGCTPKEYVAKGKNNAQNTI